MTGDIDAWASYDESIRVPRSKGATTIETAQDIADTFESLGVLEHVDTKELFDLSFVDAVSAFPQYD